MDLIIGLCLLFLGLYYLVDQVKVWQKEKNMDVKLLDVEDFVAAFGLLILSMLLIFGKVSIYSLLN